MPSFNDLSISAAGMAVQSVRLNAISSNIANVDSVSSSDGTPYKAKRVTFEEVSMGKEKGSSVKVKSVKEENKPPTMVYDPSNPAADSKGYVQKPSVDPTQEMVDMISASRSYQSNLEVLNTNKNLMLKTFELGK